MCPYIAINDYWNMDIAGYTLIAVFLFEVQRVCNNCDCGVSLGFISRLALWSMPVRGLGGKPPRKNVGVRSSEIGFWANSLSRVTASSILLKIDVTSYTRIRI